VTYLSAEDILEIHSMLIDEIGGMHGVRDMNAILALVGLPKQKISGRELYPSIFSKAAVYARNTIMNHPFFDGNKRTGMTAASIFLEDNGYKIVCKDGEIEKFALDIIKSKLSIEEIADWFKRHY